MSASAAEVIIMEDDERSDASSICQSPSWEDYKSNKKKKQKQEAKILRKQLEQQQKAESEKEKLGSRKPKRLSKAPPAIKNASKPVIGERSVTAPVLPTVAQISKSQVPTGIEGGVDRFGRGGNNSSGGSPLSQKRQTLLADSGFIGGLKLKLAKDATIQDAIKIHSSRDSAALCEQDIVSNAYTPALTNSSSAVRRKNAATDLDGQPQATSSELPSTLQSLSMPPVLTTFEEGSYASRIARESLLGANSDVRMLPADIAKTSHKVKSQRYSKGGAYYNPTAGPELATGSSRRDMINAAVEADPSLTHHELRANNSSTTSLDLEYISFSESKESNPFQPTPVDFFAQTRMPIEMLTSDTASELVPYSVSNGSSTTVQGNSDDDEDEDRYHDLLAETYTPPALDLGGYSPTTSLKEVIPTSPNLHGLRSAAKNVFSRRSATSYFKDGFGRHSRGTSSGSMTSIKQKSRPTTADRMSKADRILGESVTIAPPCADQPHDSSDTFQSANSSPSTSDFSETAMVTDEQFDISTPLTSTLSSISPLAKHDDIPLDVPDKATESSPLGLETSLENLPLHQPSLPRSQSTPMLNDLSFLPELKHQPLVKPQARSMTSDGQSCARPPSSTAKCLVGPGLPPGKEVPQNLPVDPSSSNYLRDARLNAPRASQLLRPALKQRQMSLGSESRPVMDGAIATQQSEPLAKMFVICCKCKFFHDLPSKIYEAMSKPSNTVEDKDLGISGHMTTMVACPWCSHGMSTECCSGYAAVVYLRERFH
jgi:hypothetical protein